MTLDEIKASIHADAAVYADLVTGATVAALAQLVIGRGLVTEEHLQAHIDQILEHLVDRTAREAKATIDKEKPGAL